MIRHYQKERQLNTVSKTDDNRLNIFSTKEFDPAAIFLCTCTSLSYLQYVKFR